jgi:uncharacterized membrane protein
VTGVDLPESRRLTLCAGVGVVVGAALSFVVDWPLALLGVWDATVLLMLVWVWVAVSPMDAAETQRAATREDTGRALNRGLLLAAALASLGGVLYVFMRAGNADGGRKVMLTAFAAITVVCSWGMIHTLHMLRYAHLYYGDPFFPPAAGEKGAIDFKNGLLPTYADFAYVAFTVGMTFQVADTDVRSPTIRRTVVRHGALSYLFGAVIVASVINIIADALL